MNTCLRSSHTTADARFCGRTESTYESQILTGFPIAYEVLRLYEEGKETFEHCLEYCVKGPARVR